MKLVEKVKEWNLLDKFRNKKVLALYLLGVLLLSGGVSYAYFTSRTESSGSGSIATGTTVELISEGLYADGNIGFNHTDIYPGHKAIASIRVIGTGAGDAALYDVIFNGTNTFTTPLNYMIYKTTTNIDVSYSCTQKTTTQGLSTMYYEECIGSNIESLGEAIGTGTINNGTTILKSDEILVTSEEGEEVYYYVVIEYPNLDSNQNDDMGSTISGNITIDQGEYQKPNIVFTSSTTAGSNGWVRSASITSNITTQTGIYEAQYCTTTASTCTPNTTPSISDNSFNVTLGSNASAQKVCVRLTDEYNQITEQCSNAYSVDTTNPTVSITNATSTQNSISITVRGSDSHSGIYQYRFSSNGGSSYTTVSSTSSTYTYTFNNLNSGTTYSIRVQAVDRSGRTSSTASRSVATEEVIPAVDVILVNSTRGSGMPNFANTSCSNGTNNGNNCIEATVGLYEGEENGETIYYFRGDVDDNWVSFAGFYWRIIRTNSDGSIRMIYAGTDPNVTTGTGTQISLNGSPTTYQFNSSSNASYYVSLKYSTSQHGTTTNSSIMGTLNSWYSSNLASYASKLTSGTGFCNDRDMASGYSWSATPSSSIYYAAFGRVIMNRTPSLDCNTASDNFTTSGTGTGNGALQYPIGLITADEVAMAGGINSNNYGYYLYTGQYYWTMSPSYFYAASSWAGVFFVSSAGHLSDNGWVDFAFGVRPVINLRADVQLTGTGTASNPYRVS